MKTLLILLCAIVVLTAVSTQAAVKPACQWKDGYYTVQDSYTAGLWHFDEGNGTETANELEYRSPAIFIGDPTWVSGKFGQAIGFDGSGDRVKAPSYWETGMTDFTLEAWIKPLGTTLGAGQKLISKYKNYEVTYVTPASAGGKGYIYAAFQDSFGGTNQVGTGARNITVGEWSHFAVTYNNTTHELALYINGELDDTAATSAYGPWVTDQPVFIGDADAGIQAFEGELDEVRLSRIAREFDPQDFEAVGYVAVQSIISGSTISWDSKSGDSYDVKYLDPGAAWISIGLSIPGTGGTISYIDSGDTLTGRPAPPTDGSRQYLVVKL